jgi:hypothetical protein
LTLAETGDFNGDGFSDILWRDSTTGAVAIWFIRGAHVAQVTTVPIVDQSLTIQGLNAD